MESILVGVNNFFAIFSKISSFLWSFPTQFSGWKSIPVLGQFTLLVLLLLGAGIWFTIKTGFVQIKNFKKGIKILSQKKSVEIGISPFASFMLSSAMRIGAGNITGVTGAIAVGGPGALFWMWLSAFFGMATAFVEATLSQIFKERKGDEYVGGLTHYAEKIFRNKHWVGISIAIAFLFYRLLSMPVHTFHVFTAVGTVISTVTGHVASRTSVVYYVLALVIVISLAFIVFGGIKRVTRFTDKMVPVMAIGYTLMVLFLIAVNFNRIPDFFVAVFKGAFTPDAIFGGMFGVALIQGIKRGLLSNEAGMGTTSMAAASADTKHPCEQGFVQALSVFLDTFIICSMTGFVITMGAIWENPIYDWSTIKSSVIDVFAQSIAVLMPGTAFDKFSIIFGCMAYACFAYEESKESNLTFSNGSPKFQAILSALIVFPHPGGP